MKHNNSGCFIALAFIFVLIMGMFFSSKEVVHLKPEEYELLKGERKCYIMFPTLYVKSKSKYAHIVKPIPCVDLQAVEDNKASLVITDSFVFYSLLRTERSATVRYN